MLLTVYIQFLVEKINVYKQHATNLDPIILDIHAEYYIVTLPGVLKASPSSLVVFLLAPAHN